MIKKTDILGRVKTFLAGNLAFALITLPIASPINSISGSSPSMVIPEQKLDIAFNIANKTDTPQIQIPVNFWYISQFFTSYHPGIDLPNAYGNPIKSIASGTVEFAGYTTDGYGNEVLIDNGNGMESLYAHLSKIFVKKGDTVDMNTIIGLIGATGHATGPHLHLEIHINGKAVNPLTILPPFPKAGPHMLTDNITTSTQQ
ncbi:MAG TPA: M23 family metallopeptidase [Patescibacteria group bacterium]|nr:M23 family metallopeptidase [Patescibacteria group bacterium]